MAKIAYILLCHKDPDAIIAQAERLTAAGDYIAIHFDGRAKREEFARIKKALDPNPSVVFAKKRIKCGWGEWSLVAATLSALQAAEQQFDRATHFYMLSGDCMPIKSSAYMRAFLDHDDKDYIESFDFLDSEWIKTGLKEDRLIYRHWFNERLNKKLFYKSLEAQKFLGLQRKVPKDLRIMIGSQWWCLRRETVEAVLAFTKQRKDVTRFFRTTWIPDETFFQTIVRHLIPANQIDMRTLTFLIFSDYGMPVTFYNDHYDMLLSQDFLFARKISPEAFELKERLGGLYLDETASFDVSNEGRSLFRFLTTRGREGRRFEKRFWERDATLGRHRKVLIVTCKKWHVAKRLVASLRNHSNVPSVEYLFDEPDAGLPDIGGIQRNLEKRNRHRRATMRMLFEYFDNDTIVFCLDPNNMDLLQDFYSDRSTTKLLEIDCSFSDDYLLGHARRIGLVGDNVPQEAFDKVLPTLRADLQFESEQIVDANFKNYHRISEQNQAADNAPPIAKFFEISEEQALEIANTSHLFAD